MSITIGLNAQNAMVTAMANTIGTGSLVIYSGTAPSDAKTALSGNTVLATHTVAGFGAASNGVCTASAIAAATVAATGTATFARVLVSGTAQWQGVIGSDITIDNTSLVTGGTSNVTAFTLTQPAS